MQDYFCLKEYINKGSTEELIEGYLDEEEVKLAIKDYYKLLGHLEDDKFVVEMLEEGINNYIPKLSQKCIDKFIVDDKKFSKAFQLIHKKETEIWEGPTGVSQVLLQYNENGFMWYTDVNKKILSIF